MDRSNVLHAMKKLGLEGVLHLRKSIRTRHLFACTYYQKERPVPSGGSHGSNIKPPHESTHVSLGKLGVN